MNVGLEKLMDTITINELRLWDLITVKQRLHRQFQELDDTLKRTNPTENETWSTEPGLIFDLIDDTLIEYETQLWQLLEDKTSLELKLKIMRVKSSVTTATTVAALSKSPFAIDSSVNVNVLVETFLADIKEEPHFSDNPSPCDTPIDDQFNSPNESAESHGTDGLSQPANIEFSCSFCDRAYANRVSLVLHMRVHKEKKALPCQLCDTVLKSDLKLEEHMRLHTAGASLYECKVCGENFVHKTQFEYHRKKHRVAEEGYLKVMYSCPECPEAFEHRIALTRHSYIHTGGKPFECYLCRKQYQRKVSLRHHFEQHSVDKTVECQFCDRKFTSARVLKGHVKYKHDAQFLCTECGKAFSTAAALTAHTAAHTGERVYNYECQICSKKYTKRAGLLDHIRRHNNEKYTCNLCGREYASLSGIQRHNRSKHKATNKRTYDCIVCGKKLSTSSSLGFHMTTHQEKKFKCSDCGKYFRSEYSKSVHVRRMHLGEREFGCTECNRRFFNVLALRAHQVTHTGVRAFACTTCDHKCLSAGALKAHQMTHSDVRPFKCSQCSCSFKLAGNLQQHMNRHNNVKPYSCEVCNAQFADANYIKIHMRIHTGEKPFACSVCNRRFMDQRNMKKHEKIHSK